MAKGDDSALLSRKGNDALDIAVINAYVQRHREMQREMCDSSLCVQSSTPCLLLRILCHELTLSLLICFDMLMLSDVKRSSAFYRVSLPNPPYLP